MRTGHPRAVSILVAFALSALLPASAHAAKVIKNSSALLLPEEQEIIDPDATGKIIVRRVKGEAVDRLTIRANQLDPDLQLFVFAAEQLGPGMTMVAVMTPQDDAYVAEFRQDGAGLPLGAQSLDDLAGYGIAVVGESGMFLYGTIPALVEETKKGFVRRRSRLTRPDDGPAPHARGFIQLGQHMTNGRRTALLRVGPLDPGVEHRFVVFGGGDEGGGGDPGPQGDDGGSDDVAILEHEGGGIHSLYFDSEKDDNLPPDWSPLAGMRFEIRNAEGEAELVGLFPAIFSTDWKEKAPVTGPGGGGIIKLKFKARSGRQMFSIDVFHVGELPALELFVFDEEESSFASAGTLPVKKNGKARFRIDTRTGTALPLQSQLLDDLQGAPFELRAPAELGGQALFTGVIP